MQQDRGYYQYDRGQLIWLWQVQTGAYAQKEAHWGRWWLGGEQNQPVCDGDWWGSTDLDFLDIRVVWLKICSHKFYTKITFFNNFRKKSETSLTNLLQTQELRNIYPTQFSLFSQFFPTMGYPLYKPICTGKTVTGFPCFWAGDTPRLLQRKWNWQDLSENSEKCRLRT